METFKFFVNPSLFTQRNNKFNEYRKIAKFTDLTLKSTDGKTMTVHKNILSAVCPYFEGMFNSDLIETRQELIQLVDNVKFVDLEILIEYIYTGKAKISLENAENLFCKAQYFQLSELEEFCTKMLIENIKVENCLGYWRNSVKYFNDKLTVECRKFIKSNCKSFLDFNCMDLTTEEFKLITSEETFGINQEDLYKFVVKWIKSDFQSRNLHLIELIRNLNFINFTDEFVKNEIMTDEILQNIPEFSAKITKIIFEKLEIVKKQNKQKSVESCLSNKPLKSINLVTNRGIYKLNWEEWKWTKQFNFVNEKLSNFATVAVKNNIFISGGCCSLTNYRNLIESHKISNFNKFNILTHTNTNLPRMIERRSLHELVNFKGKIYSCGGDTKNGSTEIFDFQKLKWHKGPSMNTSRRYFNLITLDNSIYAFGGWNDVFQVCNTVERFDQREGIWRIISRNAPEIISATILSNNYVYCFNNIYGGQKYDIKANKWIDSLEPVFVRKKELRYYNPPSGFVRKKDITNYYYSWFQFPSEQEKMNEVGWIYYPPSSYYFDKNNAYRYCNSAPVCLQIEELRYYNRCCDITEFNNEIFGVFQTDNSKTWGTFKYDHNVNKWVNLNIPLNLYEYDDIKLCVSGP